MRIDVSEILTRALVDEFGLDKTLQLLEKAKEKDAVRHPSSKRNPDFIGMEGYAKIYAGEKGCICNSGFGMNLSCPLHGIENEGRN